MKTILVTGANGQLGLALKAVADNYSELSFVFVGKKELDVTNEKQIATLFKKHAFEYCINAAAYTHVDNAEGDMEAAYLLNETAPRLLAEACKQHNVFLVHISTDYVFDGTKETPYTVDDIPNPINVYGASKYAGEKAIAAVGGAYCIVRTSWLYSEFGTNFQTKIIEKAKTAPFLEVVSDLYGTPTYTPNLVLFLLNKIKNTAFSKRKAHYSDGKTMSWYDLAKKVVESKTTVQMVSASTLKLKAKRPLNSAINT